MVSKQKQKKKHRKNSELDFLAKFYEPKPLNGNR